MSPVAGPSGIGEKEKEVQKSAAIPPIDAKRTAVASGGGGGVGVGGIISQRITNSPPNQSAITANINGKRELQKLPLLMETAPGTITALTYFERLRLVLYKRIHTRSS